VSQESRERVRRALEDGTIDPTRDRAMPPTHAFTGKTYYGLPDAYPFNKDGFVEEQAESARHVVYRGVSEGSEWHLRDGLRLEIWPGGAIFNEHGTLCGWLQSSDWREAL
jgi:hypothetical protein